VVDFTRLSARRPQVPLEPLKDFIEEESSDPHGYAEQRDFLNQVRSCMGELTDLQLNVILLRYGAGLSRAEVAGVLNRSQDTVAVVQHQALKKLRGLMKVKGYESYRS
jgi:RNA polymerase sigma factor (sigma-70 family)